MRGDGGRWGVGGRRRPAGVMCRPQVCREPATPPGLAPIAHIKQGETPRDGMLTCQVRAGDSFIIHEYWTKL